MARDSIDCWMYGAWSKTTVNFGAVELLLEVGSAASTALDTSTVFADGSLVTAIVSAGLPSTREMEVTGSALLAPGDVGDRLRSPAACAASVGTSGSAEISATEAIFEPVCTVRV